MGSQFYFDLNDSLPIMAPDLNNNKESRSASKMPADLPMLLDEGRGSDRYIYSKAEKIPAKTTKSRYRPIYTRNKLKTGVGDFFPLPNFDLRNRFLNRTVSHIHLFYGLKI